MDVDATIITGSNNGAASNTSDGTANIWTGDATATGNRSETAIAQRADGGRSAASARSSTRRTRRSPTTVTATPTPVSTTPTGNDSDNDADADQDMDVLSQNDGEDDVDADAGLITAANSGTASNTSDGTANIKTGKADATGNASSTNLGQTAHGSVGGPRPGAQHPGG